MDLFERRRKGEKGGGGEVGGSRCTVKGALFGIYTDMWDLGGGRAQGGWWEMHGVGGWRRRWGLGERCVLEAVLLLGIYGCDGSIHLLLRLQRMPLGDGATGVGQHVGPVFQPGPCGLASHQDLPNGVVLANLVVIQHCDHSQDFLGRTGESKRYEKYINRLRMGWWFHVGEYFPKSEILLFSPEEVRIPEISWLMVCEQCFGGRESPLLWLLSVPSGASVWGGG